jgi:predicted RNase H-like HicB family nuclease
VTDEFLCRVQFERQPLGLVTTSSIVAIVMIECRTIFPLMRTILPLVVAMTLICPTAMHAGQTQYFLRRAGMSHWRGDGQGNLALYNYDAVGICSIERLFQEGVLPGLLRGAGGNPTALIYWYDTKEDRMENHFTAVFEQDGEWWIGYVQELPGANTQGKTLDEARENLKEAVTLVLEANRDVVEQDIASRKVIKEEIVVKS